MKNLKIILILNLCLILILTFISCSNKNKSNNDIETTAIKTAKAWLNLVDEKNYKQNNPKTFYNYH